MAVAPHGRIDAVWLDTRNAANHTDSQLFYSYSLDGGDTWSANVEVSDAFDPFVGYTGTRTRSAITSLSFQILEAGM